MKLCTVQRLAALSILVACLAAVSGMAAAAVPVTLNYQGFLANPTTGAPLNAAQSITFKLWDALSAGNLLYTETQSSVAVTNGVFNVQIGTGTVPTGGATLASLAFDIPYWLEVTIGSETLTPRRPLAASAYALRATNGLNAIKEPSTLGLGSGVLVSNSLPVPGTPCMSCGMYNTGIGVQALNANTDGYSNTAVGYRALPRNTTGIWNTALGDSALASNTAGNSNVGVGFQALIANTNGYRNAAVGMLALLNNTSGNDNVAVGASALYYNGSGSQSVAMGTAALQNNTAGSGNVGIGYQAILGASGNYNTAVGTAALPTSTGSENIAIGHNAGSTLSSGSNNIFIGSGAGSGTENGAIHIGTWGVHTATYLSGQVYTTNGVAITSDVNAKTDFRPVDTGLVLEHVAALPLSTWRYKTDAVEHRHIGPTAQDFAAAFPVGIDDKHIETVDADGVALAAIQGLNAKLEELTRTVRDKDQQLRAQEQRLRQQEETTAALTARFDTQVAELRRALDAVLAMQAPGPRVAASR